MPRRLPAALLLILSVFLLPACQAALKAPPANVSPTPVAHVELQPLGESGVRGTVRFSAVYGGTEVRYALSGLAAGAHGFHVHEGTSCAPGADGTPGGAAGGHFNPHGSAHGAPDATRDRRHVGDFGNVVAGAAGTVSGVLLDGLIGFSGPESIVGRAVVVHADPDDLVSQPAGDAGARVACGIIRAGALAGSS
jgi:Cu-Zn family superoxide dismutase